MHLHRSDKGGKGKQGRVDYTPVQSELLLNADRNVKGNISNEKRQIETNNETTFCHASNAIESVNTSTTLYQLTTQFLFQISTFPLVYICKTVQRDGTHDIRYMQIQII